MSTSVVLLCAGRSKKMQSYGNRSLLNFKNDSLINHQIRTIRESIPGADIVVVLGYENEKIYQHLCGQKVRTITIDNYEETASLKSTVLGLRATTNNNAFIVHGDIFFKSFEFNLNKRKCAAIYSYTWVNDIGVLLNSSSSLLRFSYGLNNVWNKIIYLNKEGTSKVRDFKITPNNEKCLDFEMYNILIEQGLEIEAVKGNTVEINSAKDLKCVQ